MAGGWRRFLRPDRHRSPGPPVTISELIERYGEFYEEDGQRLLTHRGIVRVAREIRRAKRNGTLVMPGDPPAQPSSAA